jgi:hypothetical protein
MCEACSVPRKARFEGKTLILEKVSCDCPCAIVEFGNRGPRCIKCGHLIKRNDDEDYSTWDLENPLWTPQGRPIRRDQVL